MTLVWYTLRVILRMVPACMICAAFSLFAYLAAAAPSLSGAGGDLIAGCCCLVAAGCGIWLGFVAFTKPPAMRYFSREERGKTTRILRVMRRLRRQRCARIIMVTIDQQMSLRIVAPGRRDVWAGFLQFVLGREPTCEATIGGAFDGGGDHLDIRLHILLQYFGGGAIAQAGYQGEPRHLTIPELDDLLERLEGSLDPAGK